MLNFVQWTNKIIMNSLLVAYDFSRNAEHAFKYALFFAENLQAEVHIAWIDNSLTPENLAGTIDEELRIEKKEQMEKMVASYQSEFPEIPMKIHLGRGKVYQEISKLANRLQSQIVFAGTHGVSGYEQYWIGSNTYRITTSAPCPVVTLRGSFTINNQLSDILLPLDSTLETKKKLPFAVDLAQKFNATIHLLKIYNSTLRIIRRRIDEYGEQAQSFLDDSQVKFKFATVEADNVAGAILNYADNNNVDLIVIMTEQESTTAQRFLGPYAQQLINRATIPVMSVRSKHYIIDKDDL